MNNQGKSLISRRNIFLVFFVILGSILTLLTLVISSSADGDSPDRVVLSLTLFAKGLDNPTSITNAGVGDDRLFVTEKKGFIRIVQADGVVISVPFLDISDRVSTESEQGLLGLAFHPNYAENGYFYVNYTNFISPTRQTRISRFTFSTDSNIDTASTEEILLTIAQPGGELGERHNAGDIHFGPDGYLYIPMGDGQGGGDPDNNAQNLEVLLGKVARIAVNPESGNLPPECKGEGAGNYWVPISNPMIDGPGNTCDEIWASGLRNPWRSSFDTLTGDYYIGDVGEGTREEINFHKKGSPAGENYGWRCYEGTVPFLTGGCKDKEEYTDPVFEYETHIDGCSVTGGYVYRGSMYPALEGRYIFTDFCSGNFWDLVQNGDSWQALKHTNLTGFGYVSFGEDSNRELYVANFSSGSIYALEGQAAEFDENVYVPLILK